MKKYRGIIKITLNEDYPHSFVLYALSFSAGVDCLHWGLTFYNATIYLLNVFFVEWVWGGIFEYFKLVGRRLIEIPQNLFFSLIFYSTEIMAHRYFFYVCVTRLLNMDFNIIVVCFIKRLKSNLKIPHLISSHPIPYHQLSSIIVFFWVLRIETDHFGIYWIEATRIDLQNMSCSNNKCLLYTYICFCKDK